MSEIVPANPIALQGWESSLATMDTLEQQIAPLAARAREIQVIDPATFAEAAQVISDLKLVGKQSDTCMAPFKLKVRAVLDFIQTRLNKNNNYAEAARKVLVGKMGDYSRKERQEAAKEQKWMDKKGIEGTVEPNIPKTAGVRQTLNYPVTVEDPKALIRACLKAYKAADTKRFQFLAQFIMLDEYALRAYAKERKNPEQFNKEVPGVTCKEEAAFGGKV